jgi:RNA polymerase sigma factor (sigma-70 family)
LEKDFLKLVQENQGILLKISAIYSASMDDRKDLIQEMLLQLWKSYPSYDNSRQVKFSTWLYRVALNTALNYTRKQNHISSSVDNATLQIAAIEPDIEKKENKNKLYKCIQQLPEIDKALILLHLEGYSYAEINQVTGLTETNIGVKLTRIKKRIEILFKS